MFFSIAAENDTVLCITRIYRRLKIEDNNFINGRYALIKRNKIKD